MEKRTGMHISESSPAILVEDYSTRPAVRSSDGDLTDTSIECTGHDHLDQPIIDQVYQFPLETLYQMIFSDHQFYRDYVSDKKITHLDLGEWGEGDENGDKTRQISYTVSLNFSIGPKSAKTVETQILRNFSRPGTMLVVDTKCHTAGVPYGETFYLLSRFCLTKVSPSTTKLRISCSTIYIKKVWGIVKTFIQKNVRSAAKESYQLMAQVLNQYEDQQHTNRKAKYPELEAEIEPQFNKTSTRRKDDKTNISAKRTRLRSISDVLLDNQYVIDSKDEDRQTSTLVQVMVVLLAVLLVTYIVLFWKICMIQELADQFEDARRAFEIAHNIMETVQS